MTFMRRVRRTALVAAAGAASAYFLDPAEGEARRRMVTDRVRGMARMAAEQSGTDVRVDVHPADASARAAAGPNGFDPATTAPTSRSADDLVVPQAPAPELADGPGHGSATVPPIAG